MIHFYLILIINNKITKHLVIQTNKTTSRRHNMRGLLLLFSESMYPIGSKSNKIKKSLFKCLSNRNQKQSWVRREKAIATCR